MPRLTERYDDGSYGLKIVDCEVEKKLGQLEDIEEELGIDLIKIYEKPIQAIKQGYIYLKWYKVDKKNPICQVPYTFKVKVKKENVKNDGFDFGGKYGWCSYQPFIAYGVAWALTKEELENDK